MYNIVPFFKFYRPERVTPEARGLMRDFLASGKSVRKAAEAVNALLKTTYRHQTLDYAAKNLHPGHVGRSTELPYEIERDIAYNIYVMSVRKFFSICTLLYAFNSCYCIVL